jgi:hypothetical protein
MLIHTSTSGEHLQRIYFPKSVTSSLMIKTAEELGYQDILLGMNN